MIKSGKIQPGMGMPPGGRREFYPPFPPGHARFYPEFGEYPHYIQSATGRVSNQSAQKKSDELTQTLPLRQNPEFPVVLAGHTLLDLELAVVGPVTLPRISKTFTPPSDTSPRAAPTTPSRCNSTRGGWQRSGSASCEITTRSSSSTEVGRPLLYSIFEKAFLHHNERNQNKTQRDTKSKRNNTLHASLPKKTSVRKQEKILARA